MAEGARLTDTVRDLLESAPDAGQAETAAMYSADFLRTFSDSGVDGLLLDEGPVPADELTDPEAYRPVVNVAEHYEWPVLIRTDAGLTVPAIAVDGLSSEPISTPETTRATSRDTNNTTTTIRA